MIDRVVRHKVRTIGQNSMREMSRTPRQIAEEIQDFIEEMFAFDSDDESINGTSLRKFKVNARIRVEWLDKE